MQIVELFNTWKANQHNLALLERLEKSNEKQILETKILRDLLKSFIEIAGNFALGMAHIVEDYEDTHDVDLYKSRLANDRTYKKFKELLNSKVPK